MFDTDGFKDRARGGPSVIADHPDGVVVTINKNKTVRIAIGERLCRKMKWIRGDAVIVGFKRMEKIMGIQRSNTQHANKLRTHHQASSRHGNLHFTFSRSRIADDLQQSVMDWVGTDGRIIASPLTNGDSIYWEMEP